MDSTFDHVIDIMEISTVDLLEYVCCIPYGLENYKYFNIYGNIHM